MKYHNYGYGQSIQFVHIHRDKDGVELPVVMEFDADGARTKKPSDGKLATSEMLCFWLGFGWGAVSCAGVIVGALARGWLENLL